MTLWNEAKKVGWIATATGIFIMFYGAFAVAIDANGVELAVYQQLPRSLYQFYLHCFMFGFVMMACGLTLAVPLLVAEKRNKYQ